MKRRLHSLMAFASLTLALVLGPFLPMHGGLAFAQEATDGNIQIATLDNGLTVVMAPRAGAPVATVNVWIGVGSAQEPPELAGIAHFFEHMIFYGSERYYDRVDSVIEGWGGDANASTSFDFTEYHVTVPSEHTAPAIELMADILINGLFLAEDLESEREVVFREGEQRNDNPATFLSLRTWEAFYGSHPYGHPILGTTETVSSITREDFLNWLATWYVPNNIVVIVAGDIDPDSALRQVEAQFGGMESGPLPKISEPALTARDAVEELVLTRDVEQERLMMVWPGPRFADTDDVIALDVLLYVLSEGRSSRFYQNIIRDLGVIAQADSFYFTTKMTSIFELSAQYPPQWYEVARTALLNEIQRILDGDLSAAEMETAKTILVSAYGRQVERSGSVAWGLGFYHTLAGDPNFYYEYIDGIRNVTVDDVVAVARKYARIGTQLESRLIPESYVADAVGLDETLITLDNGLRLLIQEDYNTDVVAFQTFVGTGTSVEGAAEAGISTFTNSLLLRGTHTRTEEEIFASIENLGALLFQSQLPDMANITLIASTDTWRDAFPVYMDILTNPAFAEEEFQRLKRERLLDIEAERDSYFSVIYDQLLGELYGDSGYGNPELGTPTSIGELTLDGVRDFYETHYVPENMVISVVGPVNAALMTARLDAALQNRSGSGASIERGSRMIDLPASRPVATERQDANLTWLIMGFPGPSVASDDYAAMKVLNSIMGGGLSSRLWQEIRAEQGLAYSTGSFFPSRAGDSHLAVYAIVLPENTERVMDSILALLQSIADEGVTEDELSLAIQREIGSFILRRESAQQRAFDIGWYEMLGAGYALDAEYPDQLRAVTVADVQRIASEYLEHYVVSTLTPPQE